MKKLIATQITFDWFNDSSLIDRKALEDQQRRKQRKIEYLQKHVFNKSMEKPKDINNNNDKYLRQQGIIE